MAPSDAAKANHLISEKSPYLLQHAYNPVDWYPWGPEAFEKARKEDKPILVSIGYSTCHWCHVMERESYEDPEVGALMNKYLVNIKIDREERPDVDKIYMTAVSAMTGSGGWPLNVFITPDLKPFYGGTYFPPLARWGHPGWKDVVTQIGTSWKNPEERKKILEAGNHITDALKQYTSSATASAPAEGKPEWLEHAYKVFKTSFDATRGGFGPAPKFPMPVNHAFLLRYYARSHDKAALSMVTSTLHQMAKGGIYDHLGGGFARYSTDAQWHIPHFEKMLYDNAQLAVNYLEAYQINKDPESQRVARETLNYVARDMTHPEGGFYSAEDADSLPTKDSKEKTEGAFYVWEKKDILDQLALKAGMKTSLSSDALAKAGDLFCFRYGVRDTGNAAEDPHGEFKNKNILYIAHPIPETAKQFHLSEAETEKVLEYGKMMLFRRRDERPHPHLDDKVLAGWNGLMISAFAKGFQVLGDEQDLLAAQRSARFLKANLYDAGTQTLYRRWREGERRIPGTADDYAFVTQGLIDLYESDFDPAWLDWAIELTNVAIERFYDKDKGGFFMTPGTDPHLLIRVKEDQDNVEPAASSVMALNLMRLAQLTDSQKYRDIAAKTLQAFGTTLKESPRAMPYMLAALDFALTDPRQIVLVPPTGTSGATAVKPLLQVLHAHYIPVKVTLMPQTGLSKLPSLLRGMTPINGKATAYVCQHYSCKKPTNDPEEFEKQLMK